MLAAEAVREAGPGGASGSGGASAGGSGGAGGAAGGTTTAGAAGAGGSSGSGSGGTASRDAGTDAPRGDASLDTRVPDAGPSDAPPFDAGSSRWVPHFIGTGQIEDIVTGTPIDLPMERRLHVAMLPEGYLQSDFDADIEAWMTEVFAIEPYSVYKQAFVIWKIRLPSSARLAAADPQTADTAFNLGVTTDGSGVGNLGTMTPTRVWDAMRDFPVALSSWGRPSIPAPISWWALSAPRRRDTIPSSNTS